MEEKIDIVPGTDYKIRQNKNMFSYGIDAILLSDFARVKGRVIDLGTGSGIIPIRLAGISKAKEIYGVEIQKDVYDMAIDNVKLNSLEDKIQIVNSNIKDLDKHFGKSTFNCVVTNPPYMREGAAVVNSDDNFAISRHEIECTFKDIAYMSSYLLEPQGKMYIIHRPNRLVDIFYYMRKYNIEPKRIRFIQPNKNKEANLVLVEGVRDGNPELRMEKNLIVYDDDGDYTSEIYDIYKMKKKGED